METIIYNLTESIGNAPTASDARDKTVLDNYDASGLKNPFKDLPNISSMYIKSNVSDPLLDAYGIEKNFDPEIKFNQLNRRIAACNRYNRIMFLRLVKHCENGQHTHFWILAMKLLRDSTVYKLIAARKLDKNWYKNVALREFCSHLHKLQQLTELMPTMLTVYRQYRISPPPKVRPLGAPDKPARMFLYIWQCFFTIYLHTYIGKYQHGFRPGKGVQTAWSMAKDYLHYPFIWEFDLKNAFPNVSIPYVTQRLRKLGCPPVITYYITDLHLQTVEHVNRDTQLLEEPKFDHIEKHSDTMQTVMNDYQKIMDGDFATKEMLSKFAHVFGLVIRDENLNWFKYKECYREAEEFLKDEPEMANPAQFKMSPVFMYAFELMSDGLLIPEQVEIIDEDDEDELIDAVKTYRSVDHALPTLEAQGFLQGSGLSPVLFLFAFEDVLKRHFDKFHVGAEIVAYADDFLVFSKTFISRIFHNSKSMLSGGFEFNVQKSSNLRMNSVWKTKSFKFLGLTYDVTKDTLIGTPRTGETLTFDKEEAVDLYVRRERQLTVFNQYFPKLALPPRQILSNWGHDIEPYSYIPESVIDGTSELTKPMILNIRETLDEEIMKTVGLLRLRRPLYRILDNTPKYLHKFTKEKLNENTGKRLAIWCHEYLKHRRPDLFAELSDELKVRPYPEIEVKTSFDEDPWMENYYNEMEFTESETKVKTRRLITRLNKLNEGPALDPNLIEVKLETEDTKSELIEFNTPLPEVTHVVPDKEPDIFLPGFLADIPLVRGDLYSTSGKPLSEDLPEGWYSTGGRGYVTPNGWIDTRIGGVILSRLQNTNWTSIDYPFQRDVFKLESNPRARGTTWLDMAITKQLSHKRVHPNLFNTTSLATLDLVSMFKKKSYLKIRHKQIHYMHGRFPPIRERHERELE